MAVNAYLLFGIVALILSSRPQVSTPARYAIGIGVEVALTALALVFVWFERLPLRATLQMRRPETRAVWLALATVPGLWILGVALNLLSRLLLGYSTPVTPAQYPADRLEALLLALTTVVVAPICEEMIFRGYVQRAYETRHRWIGVVVGGFIFAAYHLRFQGLFGLVPIALALGLIAWRTESVYPSIVVHASFNAIATALLVSSSFLPRQAVASITVALVCLGLLVMPLSLTALWFLWRTTRPQAAAEGVASTRGVAKWAWVIPTVILLGIYTYASLSEVLLNRYPETVLNDDLTLVTDGTWLLPVTWHYSVQDRLGRERGQATCTRTHLQASDEIALECHASYEGFDLTSGIPGLPEDSDYPFLRWLPRLSSTLGLRLDAEPTTWNLSTTWAQPTLLLSGLIVHDLQDEDWYRLEYIAQGGRTVLSLDRTGEPPTQIDTPPQSSLMPREWAWRGSALEFQLPYGSHVTLIRAEPLEGATAVHGFLHIVTGEPLWTPAGNYVTWRVNLSWSDANGHRRVESAWYSATAPHTLMRYDDGTVSYVLTKVDPIDQLVTE